jgi:hypothetical protein
MIKRVPKKYVSLAVNNGCRWHQLSRGIQRILFFACEGDLSRKSDSYDNQQAWAEKLE